ncbi:hypothetical protein [Maricaulis maris]|uniref:Glycerophosphoryl diester phosphodiesterase membrane domain-containing protein n=1 Tax=Maricaulis maris TaxID=74318 RepID=A0A495DCP5_9PROT|nr:hypothetical protein [Maricaulis maris]RKR00090.1 hypothetical protein C7435_1288 [Maricaulis maris]
MATQSFDIGKAIFWFFIRFGEKPGGALWLFAFQALCALVLVALSVMMMGPAYINLFELIEADANGGLSDADALRQVFDIVMPFLTYGILIIPLSLLFVVMFQGAWLRFLTKGEVKPVVPIRFGGDEIRLIGVNLLYLVVAAVAYFGVAMLIGIFGFGAVMMAHGGGDAGAIGIGGGLLAFVAFLAVLVALLVFAVRLASAPALTVLDGRLRFFESWDASKGVFWQMLISYVVAYAVMMVIGGTLGFVVQLALLAALFPMLIDMAEIAEQGSQVDVDALLASIQSSLSQPGTLLALIVGFFLLYAFQVMLEAVWHSIGAYNAVRVRSGGEGEASDAPTLAADHPMGASPSEG